MERVKRKLGEGVPMDLVFPPAESAVTTAQPPVIPAASPTHTPNLNQPLLTVHYGSAPESDSQPNNYNLKPIIESDERVSLRSHDRGTPKHNPPVKDVDIDLDKKLRDFVEYLGVRRLGRCRREQNTHNNKT
jgi:hypothetical protein